MCSISKMDLVWLMLWLKGNLCCLAIGQMLQIKDCLGEKMIGKSVMLFILTKGTWPSQLCHSKSTLSPAVLQELWSDKTSILLEEDLHIIGTEL